MAIKFNCPKCKKELVVKDELAGKAGKCPGCQSVLKVPAATPAAAITPVKRKPVEEVIVEAADDDEVVAAVVDDDEDEAPRKKKKRRDDDDDDDDDDDRRPKAKKKSSRREDDDDDDDEDDDDRRSRKKRASAKRRDDDDDDDDDDDEGSSSKQNPKKRRAGFRRAALGIRLNFIGHLVYAGAMGLAVITAFILAAMSGSRGGGGGGGFIKILSYLTVFALIGGMIVNVVGSAFLIKTPGKNGELGLAIATVATAGLSLLLAIILVVKFLSELFGGYLAWMIPLLALNPCNALGEGGRGASFGAMGIGAMVILLPLIEMGRLTCLALFEWAVGKSQRDRQTASAGFIMMIVAPSVCLGMGVLLWLLELIIKSTSVWVGTIILSLDGLVLGGFLVWYAITISAAQETLEDGR